MSLRTTSELKAVGTPDTGSSATMSLAGVTMLRDLDADERSSLATKCIFRQVAGGEVVLDRFSASAAVYFLVSGSARVVHYVAEDQEITIATIAAGDTIGEISAIDGRGRSATVVAEHDCVVAELPSDAARSFIEDHAARFLRRRNKAE